MGECIIHTRPKGIGPHITYTGNYEVINDGLGNWRVKFLSSGTLVFKSGANKVKDGIDVFLVGGGGNADRQAFYGDPPCGHGGGGYTLTKKSISITPREEYTITVGGTRQESSAFGFKAAPGYSGTTGHTDDHYWAHGGNGGSGGAASAYGKGSGGIDGNDGSPADSAYKGLGQRNKKGPNDETGSTREFGEPDGKLYSRGGGASTPNEANSGNGGYWGTSSTFNGFYGCSGIVIIRNHRE